MKGISWWILWILSSPANLWAVPPVLGAKNWTQTFLSQAFRAPPGYPGKIPGYPAKKVWFTWFLGTYRTFWPPPLHVEDHYPTGKYPDSKVWVCALFSCLKYGWDFPEEISEKIPERPGKRSQIGGREPRTIATKDLPHSLVFLRGWCANCQNLRKRQCAPPPVLHSRCWSSILWGWYGDFAIWLRAFPGISLEGTVGIPPNPIVQGTWCFQKNFQNSLHLSMPGDASFFRNGSGEGLAKLAMDFPAILRVFLNQGANRTSEKSLRP